MANYNVGNIEIGITGSNSNALKSIDETIAKLKEFKKLDKDLKNAFGSVNNLSESFNKLGKTNLKQVSNGIKDITSSANKAGSLMSKLMSSFSIGKIYFLFNYFKRAAQSTLNMLKSAVDFNETLNKFQVSMGSYYERSLKFVNDITKAFNISTESIMDYMSTFKNMLSALGSLSEDTSYELSETLTRMALDYASLFNVEVERSMQQFQAVLSGQIRSIRSVSGYDVSETSIFSIYQQLGGTKTMRQLTQLEKRLLRIIALQQQMEATGAVGDFAKTINYTSNQLKQLQETFKEIKRWASQYLMFALQPIVEYSLSLAIALREVLKYMNEVVGYKYEEAGAGGFFGEQESAIDSANEALNEYKTNLLGFDKLNVLGDNGTSLDDVGMLTNAILKYESKLTDVKNKANDIAKSMLEWLGYTYDTNGNLQKTGGALDNIVTGVGMLLTSLGAFKLASYIAQINVVVDSTTVSIGELAKVFVTSSGGLVAAIAAIVAVLAILYTTNDQFKESVNGLIKSIGEVLKPILEVIFDLVKSLLPIVISILDSLSNMLSPIINDVADIILSIADVLVSLKPLFSYIIDFVSNVLLNAVQAVLNLIEAIWSIVSGIVGAVSQGLVGAFQSLAAIIEGVTKGFSALLSGDIKGFVEAFDVMADELKKIWEGVWNNIKATGIGVLNGIIQGVAKFVNGLSGIVNNLSSLLSDLYAWTGIPRIPEIPTWNPNPIELATGGVITQPTHALVGEYKGAKSNPEIVTPENLMREVFIESMLPIAQAIMSGNKEMVSAIEDMANRPIELDGRKVSENLYSHLESVAIRKGKTLFGT